MNHDETASGTLAMTWELELDDITHARFARLVVERGFSHFRSSSWPTEGKSLDAVLDRVLATQRTQPARRRSSTSRDLVGGECLAHLLLQHGRLYFDLAAHDSTRSRRRRRRCASGSRSRSPRSSSASASRSGRSAASAAAAPDVRSTCRPGPRSPSNYPAAVAAAARRADGRDVRARSRRPADPLARRAGHGQDVRAARARLGVAEVVRPPLRHRPRDVLRLQPGVHARRAARTRTTRTTRRAAGGCSCSRTPASCSPPTRRSARARACRGC